MIANVKILVLNWNGQDVILDCLDSISKIKYDNLNIIVIDNHSTDESISNIHSKFPDVKIIALDHNYGYAKAYNKAFKLLGYSEDSFYMLLNNDTTVDNKIVDEFLYAQNKFGSKECILGPKIYYMHDEKKIWYAGGKVNLPFGTIKHVGIRKEDDANSSPVSTDYITGCCIFTHNSNIDKLNGFDELFNMYCEDVDLSLRARSLGMQCLYIPKAVVWHKVSNSFKSEISKNKILLKMSSTFKLYNKHVKVHKRYFGLLLLLLKNFILGFKLLVSRLYKVN